MQYRDGKIALPKGPGLGVELDRDKLAEYAELYKRLGGYTYDRDPGRRDWYCIMPERNYADPKAGAEMPPWNAPPATSASAKAGSSARRCSDAEMDRCRLTAAWHASPPVSSRAPHDPRNPLRPSHPHRHRLHPSAAGRVRAASALHRRSARHRRRDRRLAGRVPLPLDLRGDRHDGRLVAARARPRPRALPRGGQARPVRGRRHGLAHDAAHGPRHGRRRAASRSASSASSASPSARR